MKSLLILPLAALATATTTTSQFPISSTITASLPTNTQPNHGIWAPFGCYTQSPASSPILERPMPSSLFMSIGQCTSACEHDGYQFAAVQINQCWCGNKLDGAVLATDQGDCNAKCPGYDPDVCGGVGVVNVFVNGGEGVVPTGSGGGSVTTASAPSGYTGIYTGPLPSSGSETTSGGSTRETGTVLTTVSSAGAMRNLGIFDW